jgi:hypothetical protein
VIADRRYTDLFEWGAALGSVVVGGGDPASAVAWCLYVRGRAV